MTLSVRNLLVLGAALCAPSFLAPALAAQDSVSLQPCQSDAVSPWAVASTPGGSEQRNTYVVDLHSFSTPWDTPFGVAPLVKASRTGAAFFNGVPSAQGISRRQLVNVPFASPSYGLWNGPGFGIHNDATVNTPGAALSPACNGNQFAVAFAEFGTTDAAVAYNGIVTGLVNVLPSNPARLYVTRIVAATNGCNPTADAAQFGFGSVDETGDLMLRADGSGSSGGCSVVPLTDNNVFRVKSASRSASAINMVGGGYPAGMFDLAATDLLIGGSLTVYNTPGIVPKSITGGASSLLIGTNFDKQYVRGTTSGSIVKDLTHYAPGVDDHRGNIAYTTRNFAPLNSTAGVCAILGKSGGGPTKTIDVWGINTSGSVTGALSVTLPAVVTDNATGATNLAGANEFDHYHSQVAFRGGNGQVAVGTDQQGNLLVAATAVHPSLGGNDWPLNYVAVARVTPAGAVSWTMAGYNNGTSGPAGSGKPLVLGPGGGVMGRLVTLDNVTGGAPLGPSISAPMIDSVGNVWFLSAIETFTDNDFHTGLVRAVYNPATFSYQLELVLRTGDVFHGENSSLDYMVSYLEIADSNSISSGTAWSQNISDVGHGSFSTAGLLPRDPRTLGGLVLNAGIIYDVDGDEDFTTCGDGGEDQPFNVLLYVGHRQWRDLGNALAGINGEPRLVGEGLAAAGEPVSLTLTDAKPNSGAYLFIGFSNVSIPFHGGVLVPSPDVIVGNIPTGPFGTLPIVTTWPAGVPSCLDLYFQYFIADSAGPAGASASNAITVKTP